ncbi:RDD family protein [Nocardioides currus]|nr:RDD family protein [Nocardioides currus]
MVDTASWAHRVGALVVDWIACTLIVMLVIGPGGWSDDPYAGFYTTGVYVVESAVFTALLGGSFGKLVTRLRVVRHDETMRPLELIPALVRSILVALVIPPLIFWSDGRGLHDVAARSMTVRLADLKAATPA